MWQFSCLRCLLCLFNFDNKKSAPANKEQDEVNELVRVSCMCVCMLLPNVLVCVRVSHCGCGSVTSITIATTNAKGLDGTGCEYYTLRKSGVLDSEIKLNNLNKFTTSTNGNYKRSETIRKSA